MRISCLKTVKLNKNERLYKKKIVFWNFID